jgi:hypothetical protein
MPHPRISLTPGSFYGSLVVVGDSPSRKNQYGRGYSRTEVMCMCCGLRFDVDTKNLRTGNTSSCKGQVRQLMDEDAEHPAKELKCL